MTPDAKALFERAMAARGALLESGVTDAVRLFNGFVEGLPAIVVDLYGRTLVVNDASVHGDEALARQALEVARQLRPEVNAAVWKRRQASTEEARNGTLLFGRAEDLVRRVNENGVSYRVDVRLNRDASFYLDTRHLRAWAKASLSGRRVLNTFAYTGSLGIAAAAGGAEVVQTDLNRRFLNVAKDSATLNGLPIRKADFRTGDFFDVTRMLKREDRLFDCVIVDPPYFSVTERGRVDLENDLVRLVNKVRPLVADGGRLVVVNNALYVSGSAFLDVVGSLTADGHLSIETLLPVEEDCAGYPHTRVGAPPTDPAPFTHSTKIVVLGVRRKDGRTV